MDVPVMDKLEDVLSAVEYNGGGITELKSKGCVKSVQRGTYKKTITSTATISINPVDTSHAILLLEDTGSMGNDPSSAIYNLYQDHIEILGEKTTTSSSNVRLTWQVVEFY